MGSNDEQLEKQVREAVGRSRDILELYYAVRQHFDLVSRLSTERRPHVLPRFDDSPPPWNMESVWAWSTSYVIVLSGQGREALELIGRQHWER